jgi:Concanavalin A-like lectin/glucanases superfamily
VTILKQSLREKTKFGEAIMSIISRSTLSKLLLLFSASVLISACGSGQSTEALPDLGSSGSSSLYTGDPARTDDIASFQEKFWTPLLNEATCESCHGAGGQSPTFVRDDDINLAYAEANSVVNHNDPASSDIVAKVQSGHNCWEASDNACASLMTAFIENWLASDTSAQKEIVLRAPEIKDPGATKAFPETSADFGGIHTLLTTYCSDCHVQGIQTPFIGSSDIDVSYEAAQTRIDLELPSASRLVQRLRNEFHNCWDGDCGTSATQMQEAIEAFADGISTVEFDESLVTSKALSLTQDGIAANTGGRFEDDVIALYEFKTGEGSVAYDTSGISPLLNLGLSGNIDWVGGWGIRVGPAYMDEETMLNIPNGKAQGSTSASKKIYDLIVAGRGEYSLEAWVVPNNVSQEDSRIISYSGSATTRNFALSQSLYNYEVLQRSSTTDQNEAFATADGDERLQATLQHVVVTYKPTEGRRIYVNGTFTDDIDTDGVGGSLAEWQDNFAFVLGNETDGNSLWQGTLRMVAVHNRVLTQEQITQNYNVGVGEKFFLLFSISDQIDVNEAYVVFEVSQFDSFSYLFSDPFFVTLDAEETVSNIPLSGMKLGINGKEATVGQAYKNLSLALDSSAFVEGRQTLSDIGTIINLELGADSDEFFLSFETLGTESNVVVEGELTEPAAPADLDPESDIGLKTFDEINASMSVMTDIPVTQTDVASTYTTIRQQLPSVEAVGGFLSAHQMAVTQLAIQYCNALVEDTTVRASYFPGFDFDESYVSAFDVAGRSLIIDPLLERMVGTSLNSQPSDTAVDDELNDLMDILTVCSGDCSDRTETVVKATCAAVLGSATTLVQ